MNIRNRLASLSFLLLILLAGSSCSTKQETGIVVLEYSDFKNAAVGKDVQLIDLRTNKEYSEGYIDDAIQMDFLDSQKFARQIETLDKNEPIYIYCHSGGRSGRASKLLLEKGFVKVFDNKFNSWPF